MLDKLQEPIIATFAMVTWAIWKQRNNKLWNSCNLPASDTVYTAMNELYEWIAVKSRRKPDDGKSPNRTECVLWHPPPESFVKCNIDAAFPNGADVTGLEMVLRDDSGGFIGCRSSVYYGKLLVKEGEAMVLVEAINWVRNMGYQKVVFELDSKSVVDAVGRTGEDLSEFASIIARCKLLMTDKPEHTVRFVRRIANELSHTFS
ncbi:uncharacterized protein [Primulina eburnea]|uniref:uncharacterized protein n=1 Tax=Primulina eburnea TaxID=1245227 RepID=UPI003C6C2D15